MYDEVEFAVWRQVRLLLGEHVRHTVFEMLPWDPFRARRLVERATCST